MGRDSGWGRQAGGDGDDGGDEIGKTADTGRGLSTRRTRLAAAVAVVGPMQQAGVAGRAPFDRPEEVEQAADRGPLAKTIADAAGGERRAQRCRADSGASTVCRRPPPPRRRARRGGRRSGGGVGAGKEDAVAGR
jgi:hypothetical protein